MLYANGALMHHDRNNHRIKTERDSRNLVLNTRNTKQEGGISLFSSDKKWHGFQLYAAGSYYGFLNNDWGSWDIKKKKDGEMALRISGKYFDVYHRGTTGLVRKGFPGASPSHFGLNGWIEYTGTHAGLYWGNGSSAKGWHIYPVNTADMYIRSGNPTNTALRFTCNNGTARGYVYANHSNHIGFLNHERHWRFRVQHHTNHIFGGHDSGKGKKNYSPNLYFEEDGAKSWTGNIGGNRGKIEYHSNRFYIVAGNNSNRIVQFRRDNSDKSYIDNNGYFVGPVYSTVLHVQGGLAMRGGGRSDYQTHINSDKNGFTRVYGQYGVGFLGHGVTAGGELGRFTSLGGDLKGSSLLNVGKERNFARIDICNGSSIFQQKNTHGDNLYISCLARYRHKPKAEWFMTEKGNACVLAVARNGLHMHSTNKVHNKGTTITAYSHDMMMNHNGHMYVRGGYYRLSDRRDKKNIVSIDKKEVMEKLLKLRPVTFEWKDRPEDTGVKQGLIAQEVEKVIPEIVSIMESPKMRVLKINQQEKLLTMKN